MQSVSTTYSSIWNPATAIRQHKAVIAGTEYTEQNILGNPETRRTMFAGWGSPGIGGCPAAQLEIAVFPQNIIPRMAKIELYTRLAQIDPDTGETTTASEWLPKGVFYIDTREEDRVSGALVIHAYDAMLKGEATYWMEGDTGEWPRSCTTVVNDICALMGVELDDRTILDPTIMVPFPNDWTMREILGYIAAAHCGNFVINEMGLLQLLGFGQEPQTRGVLVDQSGNAITFGGVRILVG